MNLDFDLGTILFLLGGLSFAIGYVKKKFPKTDEYFKKGAFVLNEVDDLLDYFLEEYPNNPALNTTNDIVERICLELEQAGYKVKEEDKKKIENRVKGKAAKKDGFSLEYDIETDETALKFDKNF